MLDNFSQAAILRIFGKDVLPYLGKQSILDLHRPNLLEVLTKIEQRNAWWIAQQVRGFLNQIYRFALVKIPGLEYNYASALDVVAPPRPLTHHHHHHHLRLDELPDLLRALREYSGHTQTQQGLRLLLLTGVRTGELRQATPDQFDLERGLWIIPPEHMKQLQRKSYAKPTTPKRTFRPTLCRSPDKPSKSSVNFSRRSSQLNAIAF